MYETKKVTELEKDIIWTSLESANADWQATVQLQHPWAPPSYTQEGRTTCTVRESINIDKDSIEEHAGVEADK